MFGSPTTGDYVSRRVTREPEKYKKAVGFVIGTFLQVVPDDTKSLQVIKPHGESGFAKRAESRSCEVPPKAA
jgi:hypothetical protein